MNIHDIAREAGVSIATVSRVLNKSDKVHERTRQKVQSIIDREGYTPNALARGLLTNKTRSIGVLTVDILNPYYATVIHSIERNLSFKNYYLFLCNTGGNHKEILKYIRVLMEKRVDALVFVGSVYKDKEGDSLILEIAEKIPVILINAVVDSPKVHCILCDDRMGIRLSTEAILNGGRKKILFLNTTETPSARLKEDTFIEIMKGVASQGISYKIIETQIQRLSDLPHKIRMSYRNDFYDGLIATDDLFANVAVNTLHYLRIEIPNQVWVIGYNNSYVSDQTFPHLTSIDSCMEELGIECASRLNALLKGEPIQDRIKYLKPRIIIKESSSIIPSHAPTL